MKSYAWLTDLHLNFLDDGRVESFCNMLSETEADGFFLGGDIGEAPSISRYLLMMADIFRRPIYFVLGNHDYYRGTIRSVREKIGTLARSQVHLHWLPECGIVELSPKACLLGHGLWADGRLGDYHQSPVRLNDHRYIEEFMGLDRQELLTKLNELGDEGTTYLCKILPKALEKYSHIYLMTHVPPFREICRRRGDPCDDNWLPYYSCQSAGNALVEIMQKHPDHKMMVLCGHTHGAASAQILPNLVANSAGAEYGRPSLQGLILIQ